MADTAYDEKRIRDEAAGWYAKLNNTTISTETLRAFREWRRSDERCAEAYREIEAFWRRAAKVENDPEIQRAIGEAMAREKKGLGPLPRIGPRGVAGAVIATVLLTGATLAWPVVIGRTYSTPVGEQRYVRLADGSRVRLDTDSAVRVRLSGQERRLELTRGRAVFDVAHDTSRPFLVRAGPTWVRALGTRFEIRREPSGAQVTLLEGRVQVGPEAELSESAWTLAPGQQIRTDLANPVVHTVDVAVTTSWTTGRLVFRRQSLADAVAEVNRYSARKVVVEDPTLGARVLSGVFDTGDTETFVRSVTELYGLQADRRGDQIHLRTAG